MLLTQTRLRQLLGILWLIDGLLQLQPLMFTMNMINGVMTPMVEGQPAPIAANLRWIIEVTTQNLTLVNWIIALIQISIGLCLIFGLWVKPAVIVSIIWGLIVWYGGEGLSMLLTGQASALTGAPGAVLLYPLLGLVIYPRKSSRVRCVNGSPVNVSEGQDAATGGIISRLQLRWVLSGLWFLFALLQLQPYWWQQGQISQAIGAMVGQGGLNGFIVDPVLQRISDITAHAEIPLNIALIVIFLGLGIALLLAKDEQVRPFLVLSIIVSLIIWYAAEGFGMILTGMATDFNSGLLLVVIALACWPVAPVPVPQHQGPTHEVKEPARSGSGQPA
jgi:uncharacterized membrane protein YphA (DoxX/SURF4 family)